MVPSDSCKGRVRLQLTALLRDAYGVKLADRRAVPFGGGTLPAFCFAADMPKGTIVAFGGFDSYIEEFFPILLLLRGRGWTVVAFEGPGQGEVLEEGRRSMTANWYEPVAAVLDAYGLDDVTLLGISLGGCLAIRAAAFEPRVKRVIAFDAMTDVLSCMLRQLPPAGARVMPWLLRLHVRWAVNGISRAVARRRPVVEWGLAQATHVLGCATPFDVFKVAASFRTADISEHVAQDVLLLAGADDHYVSLAQLWVQAALLTAARSVSCRVFSRADDAQAHCQIGNLPLAISVMVDWLEQVGDTESFNLGGYQPVVETVAK
jgi:alpha-beta hydrolase superfamily lysophospholipase